MKSSKRPRALRLIGQFVVPAALLALVVLQMWTFVDESLSPGEEVIVAATSHAANSERDRVSLLLARQLGLANVAPLPQEEAKRQFWASQIEINKLSDSQSRHNGDLHDHFLGQMHVLKMTLLLVAAVAASLETYGRIKSLWNPAVTIGTETTVG